MPWTVCSGERRCSELPPLVKAGAQLSAGYRCCPLLSPASCPSHAPRACSEWNGWHGRREQSWFAPVGVGISSRVGRGPSSATTCLIGEGRRPAAALGVRGSNPPFSPSSGAGRRSEGWVDPRVQYACCDRSCPPGTRDFRCHADPARTMGSRCRLVADACGAPVLRDQGPIDRPGTARPIKASSRTAGYLSVTCDPGTAPAHMYIHRRCSSRGSRRSRIRAVLRQTVAAAAAIGHRIHRWAVTRPRRPWRGFPAATFASPPRGNPRVLGQ
jgi:hypothetical protein